MSDKLLAEMSTTGRTGFSLPELPDNYKGPESILPLSILREEAPNLPELSEPEVVRHFTALSIKNHHIDKGMYPLGSCTMKYNPRVNELTANLPGFTSAHPLCPVDNVQGELELLYELKNLLAAISGMDSVTLQPAAGAHGEFTALLMMRAYHEKNKDSRKNIIIPDSAHGTNPASVMLAGFNVIKAPSNDKGLVDVDKLAAVCDRDTAGFMLTNPNTLGLFETEIEKIAAVVHDCGGLLYMDGANLNALLGLVRPGDMDFDIVHFNMHKTFSAPHGGGGPGGGALGIKSRLEPFMPAPVISRKTDKKGGLSYYLDNNRPDTIGRVHGFYGNTAVAIRAYTYIRKLGAEGLRQTAEAAIINANYLRENLKDDYILPFNTESMHEFVLSGDKQLKHGVKTYDIAKRILDFGMHAPTVYFPLIVHEAMMIEPTETESRQSLDYFIEVMKRIAKEARENPEIVKSAPSTTPVGRLNEALAARNLDVCW
ncbi:MAG: aminomethyl-transferring glycine dehydrogenase subunit GcvPB [candidate division Zixibacteria bacterium]|nr:aminomethyl-transferring glycine dehydrogenase subunit GcvPB [candidate division Zixibacteria bacterium]